MCRECGDKGRPGSPGCRKESEARMMKVNFLTLSARPAGLSKLLYPWPDPPRPLLITPNTEYRIALHVSRMWKQQGVFLDPNADQHRPRSALTMLLKKSAPLSLSLSLSLSRTHTHTRIHKHTHTRTHTHQTRLGGGYGCFAAAPYGR